MIRRLAYCLLILPLALYLWLRWIVTGKGALEVMDRFENWSGL